MARGALRTDRMVTHRFGLAQSQAAFDLVSAYSDGVMKAMIDVG
jgi:threonine dehydrogenase-like Zn-dependent dehydrogenase